MEEIDISRETSDEEWEKDFQIDQAEADFLNQQYLALRNQYDGQGDQELDFEDLEDNFKGVVEKKVSKDTKKHSRKESKKKPVIDKPTSKPVDVVDYGLGKWLSKRYLIGYLAVSVGVFIGYFLVLYAFSYSDYNATTDYTDYGINRSIRQLTRKLSAQESKHDQLKLHNQQALEAVDKKINQFYETVNSKIDQTTRSLSASAAEVEHLQASIEAINNTLDDRFYQYLSSQLPSYLPVIKQENGEYKTSPDFDKYLRQVIQQYASNNTVQAFNQTVEELLTTQYGFEVIKLKHDSFEQYIKDAVSKSSKPFVLDTNTEAAIAELINKLINENQLKYNSNYNYADYENGARIVPDLVASFDSFNITELHKQQSWLKTTYGKWAKSNKNLVLNTYQAILPNIVLPKDNHVNLKSRTTGVKTFAVKFPKPIYLTDIYIQYPRYEKYAVALYSCPKKISIWIKLTSPEADLARLKKYLFDQTRSKYQDQYVLNYDKLEKNLGQVDDNQVPMRRIKSPEEISYEQFYESNFGLFDKDYVKIGSVNYDIESRDVTQRFEMINSQFKNLKISIDSVFFAIEANHGDTQSTNLFKVQVYGVSEFDVYCMKKLLPSNTSESLGDLEVEFNNRFVRGTGVHEQPLASTDLEDSADYF